MNYLNLSNNIKSIIFNYITITKYDILQYKKELLRILLIYTNSIKNFLDNENKKYSKYRLYSKKYRFRWSVLYEWEWHYNWYYHIDYFNFIK